ncbi:MAG: hypothetical protein ACF8PN_08050 [Phycisphaerales bacterium]
MSMFVNPSAGGDRLSPGDVYGHLLIVKPIVHQTGIQTEFGEGDAVECNVADLSTGEFHSSVLWFSGALVGALKKSIGEMVLAVMSQGEAKPGKSAPWILQGMADDPASVQAAQAWLQANPGLLEGVSNPAPAAPAPAPAVAPQPQVAPVAPVQPAPVAPAAPAQPVAPVQPQQNPII